MMALFARTLRMFNRPLLRRTPAAKPARLLPKIIMHKSLRCSLLAVLIGNVVTLVHGDEVTDWNQIMLNSVRTAGSSPIIATRVAATVHAAAYDAYNGIEQRYGWIHVQPAAPAGASRRAAVVQAAYASLAQLYPAQAGDLATKRSASLGAISSDDAVENSQSIALGIQWGQAVANAVVAWRNADGFTPAPPPNTGGMAVGQWRPTPPGLASFAAVQLGFTTNWILPSPLYIPLPGPPALTSAKYAADFNEVKSLGNLNSATRTADQTLSARFWATASSPTYQWNRLAVALGAQRRTTLSENARILALLNVAIADACIAVWRAKHDYMFWRPITAIQLATSDNNPATLEDAAWTPLITTPPYPDYPSGLCGLAGAALTVLADYFGENSHFTVETDAVAMAGVLRSFTSFEDAASELVDARIVSGIHFRFADEDAVQLGANVAHYILANACLPLHGQKTGQLRK